MTSSTKRASSMPYRVVVAVCMVFVPLSGCWGGADACVPGTTRACSASGCEGAQMCNLDRESYGACLCGAEADLGIDAGGNPIRPDAMVAMDMGSEDAPLGRSVDGRPDGALVGDGARDGGGDVDIDGALDGGPLKAFPSAYGGGATVSGARADENAVLVIVDTLDHDAPLVYDAEADVYAGGLEAAIEDELEGRGRYIVFHVSGVIDGGLSRTVDDRTYGYDEVIRGDRVANVTVFGQSAPAGGITLHRAYLTWLRSENIILRYLTSRPGLIQGDPIVDDRNSTGIVVGASRVIVDHCSSSWGGDKGLIVGDWREGVPLVDTTVQRSLVADSATLAFSVNGRATEDDLRNGGNVTWHYNLLAGGNRTPNIGGFAGLGVVQNNVIQSNGTKLITVTRGEPRVNVIGNYFRVYRSSHNTRNQFQPIGPPVTIFSSGNHFSDLSSVWLEGTEDEDNASIWQYFGANGPLPTAFFRDDPHEPGPGPMPHPAPLLSAGEAFDAVLADVGNNRHLDNTGRAVRGQDSYDQAAIENARNDELSFRRHASDWELPAITSNVRPPDYDSDRDGMSDAWERRTFGDLSQGYRDDHDGDGYTNIEEYMNQVDFVP
ncbi:MAG: hypothetical protein AAF411_25300 [Myxococcota bacterium]